MNIFKAAGHIIQAIFALPAFVVFTGYSNCAKLGRQQVFSIIKSKANLGNTAGTAGFTPIKNKALQVFTAQVTYFMLPYYPANAVNNITFTASIGANYPGDALIKMENGFIGKTFKSLNF